MVKSMSVTLYIEKWDDFPTVSKPFYADEEFPGLDLDYFLDDPDYAIQNGRAFTIKEVPENPEETPYTRSMSYSTFSMILKNIGIKNKDVETDSMKFNELFHFKERIEEKLKDFSHDHKNISEYHILPTDHDYVLEVNYKDILRVVNFAIKNKRGIFWA